MRIPHGWWLPELPGGLGSGLSNAMRMNDGAVFPDEEWNLDPAQGLPNLRGGIHVRVEWQKTVFSFTPLSVLLFHRGLGLYFQTIGRHAC